MPFRCEVVNITRVAGSGDPHPAVLAKAIETKLNELDKNEEYSFNWKTKYSITRFERRSRGERRGEIEVEPSALITWYDHGRIGGQ